MAVSPYVRTVKTASGARAVHIVHSSCRGSRQIEHIGSAHDAELEALKAVARQRLATGQQDLDLRLDDGPVPGGTLEIVSSQMEHQWDALSRLPGAGICCRGRGDEVFRQLVLAR